MNNKCVLTIDMGGTFLKGAIIDENYTLVGNVVEVKSDSSKDFETIKSNYKEMVDKLLEMSSNANLEPKALDISAPGPFDYSKGISYMQHKYQSIYKKNLKEVFNKELGLNVDVYFEHDAVAFLNGEVVLAKKENENVVGITLGTGLGFALIENNKVERDELGSPKLELWNAKYLNGIAEDYVSARGLIRVYRELTRKRVDSGLALYNKAKQNDAGAINAFKEFGKHIVNVIKPYINSHKVTTLILGGQVSKSYEFFMDVLKENLKGVDIIVSTNSNSTLIGLAKLCN